MIAYKGKTQAWQKVMAAYHRGMTYHAGWLPVHQDQLRAQRSVTSMGELYFYLLLKVYTTVTWLHQTLVVDKKDIWASIICFKIQLFIVMGKAADQRYLECDC